MTHKFFQRALIVSCAFLIAGCGTTRWSGKQNVLFYDHVGHAPENVVRLYIDRQGSLYPQTGFSDSYAPFDDVDGDTLRAVVHHVAASDVEREFCGGLSADPDSDLRILCTEKAENTDKSWRQRQEVLWDRVGARIHKMASKGEEDRTLVFLIHGFNVANARQPYEIAEEFLSAAAGNDENLLFVEIHWDGWTSPLGLGVWGEAQTSGPLVGFEMRQLFSVIASAYEQEGLSPPKVRVLTHSSGAIVVGSLFGNPIAALPNLRNTNRNSDYEFFAANLSPPSGRYRIPDFPDIRIGMLAAATPASTFVGRMPRHNVVSYPRDEGFPDAGILSKNTTLLISINEKDFALTKGGVGANSAQTGATGLGTIPESYCEVERRLQGGRTPKVQAFGFNFNRAGGTWDEYEDIHDFPLYLAQANAGADGFSFLKFLMGAVSNETARQHAMVCPS
ncbi:MAG: hypothetical protein P1U69_06660 [Parvibaculaceae bacterium]|mgnify:CR=1 FL=1|nr:hypothetical protein [Parvibaculaceae bacterium]HBM88875.1 hypothetical protein [Rhodobiaceae bacterium]|tara:strand:+ start:561 stop:1904 length:1344 start_codon:yes stop_codon:yes gene_type:complete